MFLIDDAPINAVYYIRKCKTDFNLPVETEGFESRWKELEDCKIIPNNFWEKFGKFSKEKGVKGKITVLPVPAGFGALDDPYAFPMKNEMLEFIDIIKTHYLENYDITPEILTHTLAWDIQKRESLPITEYDWSAEQDEETLTNYMTHAFRILKNVGIQATGMTQPKQFEGGDQNLYARALLKAVKKVNGIERTFYFMNEEPEAAAIQPGVVIENGNELVVDLIATCDEAFWVSLYGEGDPRSIADYYISEDGTKGRFIDLIRTGSPLIFYAHGQSLYSKETEIGFEAMKIVVDRVEKYLLEKVEWMSVSEYLSL